MKKIHVLRAVYVESESGYHRPFALRYAGTGVMTRLSYDQTEKPRRETPPRHHSKNRSSNGRRIYG